MMYTAYNHCQCQWQPTPLFYSDGLKILIREEAAHPAKKISVGRHIPEPTWLRWIGFNFEDSIIKAEKKGLTNTE